MPVMGLLYLYLYLTSIYEGYIVAQLVEVLRYKTAGRRFDSRLYFFIDNPSGCTMTLGFTQPLTEMSTRKIFCGYRRPLIRADNLTTFMCRLS
jgi:hypothetical protein